MSFPSWLRNRRTVAVAACRNLPSRFRPAVDALEDRLCLSDVSFGPPITWNPGDSALGVTVGDFNGDGNADLGIANYGNSDTVSVLFGNGGGQFTAPRSFVVGAGAFDVAAADFNGDGYDDLAVARQLRNSVNVLLGDAGGNLQMSFALDMPLPWSVAVGDFNEDGKPDLAFGGENASNVKVLLGDGAGQFGGPTTFPAFGREGIVEVGDFNGDGHVDLVVVGDETYTSNNVFYPVTSVNVLLGDGTGNFGNAPRIQFTSYGTLRGVGDFNSDGYDDLAIGTQDTPSAGSIHLLLSEGTGAFAAPVDFPVEGIGHGVVADFDGDGHLDLAAARTGNASSGNNDAALNVFIGDGRGGLTPSADFPLGLAAVNPYGAFTAGDFNKDGQPDLAVTGRLSSSQGSLVRVSVLLNTTPNHAPVIADQAFAVNENSADGTVVGTVAASDPDAAQTLSYRITAGNTSGAFGINSSTGQITVANSAALDYETTPTFLLTVQVTDNGSPAESSWATVTINLVNVNEAPVNSVPTVPQAVTKNRALTFARANGNAISIADPDAATELVQVTLTVRHGKLTLARTAGLTFQVGDGKNDATMTFRGTIAAINAALDGLTYMPDKGYVGADSLTIATNDLGSGGGNPLIDTDEVALLVQDKK